MGPLQKALKKQIADIPRLTLRKMLERKLLASGSEVPSEAVDALTEHILGGNLEEFHWDDGDASVGDVKIKISLDDSDLEELSNKIEKLPDAITAAIMGSIEDGGKVLYRQLIEEWHLYREPELLEISEFNERLAERWGDGIQLLRMILAAAREMGTRISKRNQRSKSTSHMHRRFVLVRLHMRACQVADEIITLLENGFADGAMARWRTLYEIDVVATVIEDADEDLARRYIDHDVVDQKKQIDDWDQKMASIGERPVDQKTRRDVERRYKQVIAIYGSEFRHDYGWAAHKLKMKKPDFKDLQLAANQTGMSTYYKLANLNVHAGSRSMFVRLSDLGSNVPIAGRSNAGLLEPGQNTAFTLTRITATILGRVRDLDGLIEMRALTLIRDAAQKAFQRADRKLSREDALLRREQAKRALARAKKRQAERGKA